MTAPHEGRDATVRRPSSVCFKQGSPDRDVSVYLASMTKPEDVMAEGDMRYLASVEVGVIRSLGLGVVRDSDGGKEGHALITGEKTRRILRELVMRTEWVEPFSPSPTS